MQHLDLIVGLVTTVIGATWALRSKLTDIEKAIAGHIATDEELHKAQDAKILKLEKRGRR